MANLAINSWLGICAIWGCFDGLLLNSALQMSTLPKSKPI